MIYVITHKVIDDDRYIDYNHYKVLHVGTNDNCLDSYLRDDTGDNISKKNANYCELTGLYWIWKNAPEIDEDITGLVHYRRFFTTRKEDFNYKYFGIMPKVIDYSSIEGTLSKADIIIPQRVNIISTLKSFYGKFHDINDIDRIRQSIVNVCPEYVGTFDAVMLSHSYIYGNMMICRKSVLNSYAKWLFDIMDDFEDHLNISKYEDSYQSRIYGFLSERLLQVWIKHNRLKCAEYPVFNTESRTLNLFDTTRLRIKTLIKKSLKGKIKE